MRFFRIFLLAAALACLCHCDDSPGPGFFLKITKNVPRLGRRSENNLESFFTKNSKTIPRIGRAGEETHAQNSHTDISSMEDWLTTNVNTAHSISKRMMMNGAAAMIAAERELSVVQPVNSNTLIELLNKDAIPSENVKFVHWKDFDRALQSDMDLYQKVISLGRRPDQRLKEDLGFGTYVPISFFSTSNRQRLNENYNDNPRNELYEDKYQRDMLKYNELNIDRMIGGY